MNGKVTVSIGMGLTAKVDQQWLDKANEELTGWKQRNPFDRFTVPENEIVGLIASTYQKDNEYSSARGLIGSLVKVGGKGWTSY